MSDGASAPAVIRHLLRLHEPAFRAIWLQHDRRYYFGGTEARRLWADAMMLADLVEAGMDARTAEQVYDAVRAWGAPHFHSHTVIERQEAP